MSEEKQTPKEIPKAAPVMIERIFEQPPDAISFYCDLGQVFSTGNEVVVQFYEAIPGPPSPQGNITRVRTRLRATVTFSTPHAKNIGKTLIERTEEVKK
jgi:hypothetical protein